MNINIKWSILGLACLVLGGGLYATSVVTGTSKVTSTIALAFSSYAKTHQGEFPKDVAGLQGLVDIPAVEELLNGSLASKFVFLTAPYPRLDEYPKEEEILALIGFPISEDRRESIGRYVILRDTNGGIYSYWLSEKTIQSTLGRFNIVLPPADVFVEKPLLPISPEYSRVLLMDALSHGVSLSEASAIIEKHVIAARAGTEKSATTWAEITSGNSMPQPSKNDSLSSGSKSVTSNSTLPLNWLAVAVVATSVLGLGFRYLRRKQK